MAQSTRPHLERIKEFKCHTHRIRWKHTSTIMYWLLTNGVQEKWSTLRGSTSNSRSMLSACFVLQSKATNVKMTGLVCALIMACCNSVLLTASEWVSGWALHSPELQPDATGSFLLSSYYGRADWKKPNTAETSSFHTPPPRGPQMYLDQERSRAL